MKKLLIILILICTTPSGRCTIKLSHRLHDTPTVSKVALNYERINHGKQMISKVNTTSCIPKAGVFNCFFTGQSNSSVLLMTLEAFKTHKLTATWPNQTGTSAVWVTPWRTDGTAYKYTWSSGTTSINLPAGSFSTYLNTDSIQVASSITGQSSGGLCCELLLDDTNTGERLLLSTLSVLTDYSAGGELLGLTISPTVLWLSGPKWSGSVQISGAGSPGVLRIRSDTPVNIDLGAGPSETGLDFETSITGSDLIAMAYRGKMTISGTVARPGVQNYTIKLEYEVL